MKPDWQQTLILETATIRDAIKVIDSAGFQIAMVVNEKGEFLGTVTDGDVRRGLLHGSEMSHPVLTVTNRNPHTAADDASDVALLALMKQHLFRQIPLINTEGRLTGLVHANYLQEHVKSTNNPVILMAGGLGKRLRPMTEKTPKPLLPIGDKPLLEMILENFIHQGFSDFYISVNYRADTLKSHFGNGSRWGVSIRYLEEEEPLGTAGALRLLPEKPKLSAFVMNGDLLTRVNFKDLLSYHHEQSATATMCVREYDMEVPFGVVSLEGNRIQRIDEKPVHRFFVNAGIYLVSPEAFDLIPNDRRFDMTELFEVVIANNLETAAFPIHEYWLDIGRLDDFERANLDFRNGQVK